MEVAAEGTPLSAAREALPVLRLSWVIPARLPHSHARFMGILSVLFLMSSIPVRHRFCWIVRTSNRHLRSCTSHPSPWGWAGSWGRDESRETPSNIPGTPLVIPQTRPVLLWVTRNYSRVHTIP